MRIAHLLVVFGIIWSGLTYAEDEELNELDLKKGMVLVEPVNVIISQQEDESHLTPYRERRPRWGTTVSVGYSSYEPLNYEPEFVASDFSQVYGTPEMPLIELQFAVKRNFALGSLAASLAAGMYRVNSKNRAVNGDSSLRLIPVRVGGVFYMDALAADPVVVPYLGGGAYSMVYNESLGGNSRSGNTQVAGYVHGGLAITLGWLDNIGSIVAYRESGLENTYAYVEAQKYLPAGGQGDGDFSNEVSWAGGLRLEF